MKLRSIFNLIFIIGLCGFGFYDADIDPKIAVQTPVNNIDASIYTGDATLQQIKQKIVESDNSPIDLAYWRSRDFVERWRKANNELRRKGPLAEFSSMKRSFTTPKELFFGEFEEQLVVFGNPFSQTSEAWIKALAKLQKDSAPVQFVFRPYFDGTDPKSMLYFTASYCLEEISAGHFWHFLKNVKPGLSPKETDDIIREYVKAYELDEESFNQCWVSQKFKGQIEEQLAYARSLGIDSAPLAIGAGFVFKEFPGNDIFAAFIFHLDKMQKELAHRREVKGTLDALPWYKKIYHRILVKLRMRPDPLAPFSIQPAQ